MFSIVILASRWCRIWNPFVSIYYRFEDSMCAGVYTSQDSPSDNIADFHETFIFYVIRHANAKFHFIFTPVLTVLKIYRS